MSVWWWGRLSVAIALVLVVGVCWLLEMQKPRGRLP